MAYQTRDVIEAMRADSGVPLVELKADGGASAMDLLLQLQADLLSVPVRRSRVQETTALGAAYLAGLGRGIWGSTEELAGHWRPEGEFSPRDPTGADDAYRGWRRAVERSLRWESPEPGDRP
jgi:glycerol kinase